MNILRNPHDYPIFYLSILNILLFISVYILSYFNEADSILKYELGSSSQVLSFKNITDTDKNNLNNPNSSGISNYERFDVSGKNPINLTEKRLWKELTVKDKKINLMDIEKNNLTKKLKESQDREKALEKKISVASIDAGKESKALKDKEAQLMKELKESQDREKALEKKISAASLDAGKESKALKDKEAHLMKELKESQDREKALEKKTSSLDRQLSQKVISDTLKDKKAKISNNSKSSSNFDYWALTDWVYPGSSQCKCDSKYDMNASSGFNESSNSSFDSRLHKLIEKSKILSQSVLNITNQKNLLEKEYHQANNKFNSVYDKIIFLQENLNKINNSNLYLNKTLEVKENYFNQTISSQNDTINSQLTQMQSVDEKVEGLFTILKSIESKIGSSQNDYKNINCMPIEIDSIVTNYIDEHTSVYSKGKTIYIYDLFL